VFGKKDTALGAEVFTLLMVFIRSADDTHSISEELYTDERRLGAETFTDSRGKTGGEGLIR